MSDGRAVRLHDGTLAGSAAKMCDLVKLMARLPGMNANRAEELTPISPSVLAQLLAHRVAVVRGFDPDSPRKIHKVTRTW